MDQIDEQRLEEDVNYRFEYMARFIGYGEDEARAIREVAKELAPRLDPVMSAIYDRFRLFDATWRHFTVQKSGCPCSADRRRQMEELTSDHGTVLFRKHKLAKYFNYLMARPLDRMTVRHMDQMGRKHKGNDDAGHMDIALVQMNAFMAFIADGLTGAILDMGLDREREVAVLRAVQKLMWLHADLISRHYQGAATAESGLFAPRR